MFSNRCIETFQIMEKHLVEIVINPIVGRYINDIVGLLIGLSTLLFLIYLASRLQRKE
jgi:ABC-type dipeptide/oligopeptide/nickel transport system permease subunit